MASLSSSEERNALITDFSNLCPTLQNFKNSGFSDEEIINIITQFIEKMRIQKDVIKKNDDVVDESKV